jgi:sec-independent protein translocase protein TatA
VGNLGPWEILIIAGVIILLFGARKMPEMARSLGKSARILKAETKGMRSDEAADEAAPAAQIPPAQPEVDEVEKLRKQLEAAELREKVAAAEARAKAVEEQAAPPAAEVAAPIEQTQANKNNVG